MDAYTTLPRHECKGLEHKAIPCTKELNAAKNYLGMKELFSNQYYYTTKSYFSF